uniref:Uncharacterized protein n=1 Tax=Eutreptiella gymnastica TaxID=73025 RepID=A0A7S1NN68_9EUGL
MNSGPAWESRPLDISEGDQEKVGTPGTCRCSKTDTGCLRGHGAGSNCPCLARLKGETGSRAVGLLQERFVEVCDVATSGPVGMARVQRGLSGKKGRREWEQWLGAVSCVTHRTEATCD